MKLFVFGSSLLSSYWNGAATYYRGIYRALHDRGCDVTFAEPDAYGRQQKKDSGDYSYARSVIYKPEIDIDSMLRLAQQADVVIKHSGIGADDQELELRVLELASNAVVIFWDVDAPATLSRLHTNRDDAFSRAIRSYDAVFTYGGGPQVEAEYLSFGARHYVSIYNGLDSSTHFPVAPDLTVKCDLLFVGNRLPDREERVNDLFLRAAELAPDQTFLLGGEGWADKRLPENVRWLGHVPTGDHNRLNCSARMVLNINRASMATYGYAPPTRVFEVAGSGSCLLCDEWPGMADCFEPGREVLIVRHAEDVVSALKTNDAESSSRYGQALRQRALRDHTYDIRAEEAQQHLETLIAEKHAAAEEKVGA